MFLPSFSGETTFSCFAQMAAFSIMALAAAFLLLFSLVFWFVCVFLFVFLFCFQKFDKKSTRPERKTTPSSLNI